MAARETKPSLDARLEPEPEAGEDDGRHCDPAYEEGGRRDVRDGTVEIAEDGDAEDEVERADEGAFFGGGPAQVGPVAEIGVRGCGEVVHGRSLLRVGGGLS